MMRFLRGDGWDRAHWAQLFQILGFPAKGPDAVQVDNLALSHFLGKAAAILEKTEEIKALHAQAQGEVTIKEAIQQLEVWGYDRQFALLLHEFPDGRRHVALIKEWKEITWICRSDQGSSRSERRKTIDDHIKAMGEVDLSFEGISGKSLLRMTAAVGLPTLRLVRTRIGPWSLAGLASGEWRELAPSLPG